MSSQYGHFDDAQREFVITRPDTPLPWLNFLGQETFFGLCTNTAGGYSFWKDAKLRRITRYRYNNVPMDLGGRYLYIDDAGSQWNPMWKPMKTKLDSYECRFGQGYTKIHSELNGLATEVLMFIPLGENTEIWKTTLTNKSDAVKEVKLYSFVEFCFYEALNDMTNYQRTYSIGEVEVDGSAIYHKTEYRERRSHYTLFGCTRAIDSFDTSRDAFVGVHNGLHEPKAVLDGGCTGSHAHGWSPIGAHQINLTLKPGESVSFSFLLSYVEQTDPKFIEPMVINKSCGQAIMDKYTDMGNVDKAFAELNTFWDKLLGVYQAECPHEDAQRMVNVWNPYQCMATFNLSRSASLYESGIGRGMGFRDSNQDQLGFVHMIPERARERILDIAATQLSSGLCYHQYQPLTKKGNAEVGGDFYDDHLWLVLSTCAYIKESGDLSILNEAVGYADIEGSKNTLLEHLEVSIKYTLDNCGPHGLPLIGHADWNDCLNLNCFSTEPNESFQTAGDVEGSQAESVMIAGLFLYACNELASLYDFMGKDGDASRIRENHAGMLEVVEKEAWDGEWYRRAYDAHGKPVGSKECEEGKIYIESQGWCIMGGAGRDNGRAQQAMESVNKLLFTENGVVLQQPPYKTYHLELGEVSSYPPGYKENAGIFSHNNTWIQIAWTLLGDGERAMEYYLSINPSAKLSQGKLDTYRSEPYVYAQMTAGKDAASFGEAKNSWLTGTAAWSYVVISQYILGVRPDYEALVVDPCVPKDWKNFRITRKFRGTTFNISVENPNGVSKGIKSITVDGETIKGNRIPLSLAKAEQAEVKVVLG